MDIYINHLKQKVKYQQLVNICQGFYVIALDDEHIKIILYNQQYFIVPSFIFYDYSFRPKEKFYEKTLEWAT